jgi:hypothetical protein
MTNYDFCEIAKQAVHDYAQLHLDVTDGNIPFDVYIVWNCYILGNIKALLSTTLADGMYYEVTYDKNNNRIYLDAYKKFENKVIEEW